MVNINGKILAPNSSRFVAYFIDMLVISLLSSFIFAMVCLIIGHDTNVTTTLQNQLMTAMSEYLEAPTTVEAYDKFMNMFQTWFKYAMLELGIQSIIYFVLISVYLVIMPTKLQFQTLGRKLGRVLVVDKDGNTPTMLTYAKRELIGTFLLYTICGSVFMLITLILVLCKNRSIVDYVGGTNLVVDPKYVIVNNPNMNNQNQNNFNNQDPYNNQNYNRHFDSIDAEYKDVDDDNKDDNNESKYKVF